MFFSMVFVFTLSLSLRFVFDDEKEQSPVWAWPVVGFYADMPTHFN